MRKTTRFLSLLALLMMAATGAMAQTTVNGRFTVNADGDQVQFASGNLRYTSGAWSFFDHQYDYYAEYSANSWDKFGWSTSGTTYGMSTSTNESLYKGDFVDWGNAVGTGWRTLSNDEWAYVVNTRSGSTIGTTANARFAKAKVNDVQGLILFPDTYTHPDGVTAPTGVNATGNTGWNGNNYTAADWTKMESAGCVFLPAAGGRYNYSNPTLVVNAGNEGNYWSSTSNNSTANLLTFNGYTFDPSITDSPRSGYSVRLVKSVTTYAVSLKEGTEDADKWKGNVNDAETDVNLPITKLEGGEKVTLKYSGDRQVKSVTATTDAKPDPLTVPLTIEAITAGRIMVSNPKEGMQYSLDGGATKTAVTPLGIDVEAGDKVQFYGNGTSITCYGDPEMSKCTRINGIGDGFTCKVYGNIMSLLDEENFAKAETLSDSYTFKFLFLLNRALTDASGLLLPATQLAESCYMQMFYGCDALTAAPALPAETLAYGCYQQMFNDCSALTAAPVLPAKNLVMYCYTSMFNYCEKLATVTCLATSGFNQNECTSYWLNGAGSQAEGTKTVNTVSSANWPSGDNGIPTGWTRVNIDN